MGGLDYKDGFEEGFEKGYNAALEQINRQVNQIDLDDSTNRSLNALGMKMLVQRILNQKY